MVFYYVVCLSLGHRVPILMLIIFLPHRRIVFMVLTLPYPIHKQSQHIVGPSCLLVVYFVLVFPFA